MKYQLHYCGMASNGEPMQGTYLQLEHEEAARLLGALAQDLADGRVFEIQLLGVA